MELRVGIGRQVPAFLSQWPLPSFGRDAGQQGWPKVLISLCFSRGFAAINSGSPKAVHMEIKERLFMTEEESQIQPHDPTAIHHFT